MSEFYPVFVLECHASRLANFLRCLCHFNSRHLHRLLVLVWSIKPQQKFSLTITSMDYLGNKLNTTHFKVMLKVSFRG